MRIIRNQKELQNEIRGRRDCEIYYNGLGQVDENLQSELKMRNINLIKEAD